MDYKKKYNEALERANKYNFDGAKQVVKDLVFYIFPELKESEDERIRKEIIATIHLYYGEPLEDEAKEMIAWLEKQGEHKPIDKVEPKFKVGDWVVYDKYDKNDIDKIVKFDNDKVSFESGDWLYINQLNEDCKLWTIQDAKDGDVLASNRSIFIFSQEYIAGKPEAHCGIMNGLFLVKPEGCWTNEECYPATKEQRGLLFQKIKDAGYKWDEGKKELRKIEQKPQRMISAEAKEAMYDKPTDNDMVEALRTEYEKGRADVLRCIDPDEMVADFCSQPLSMTRSIASVYRQGIIDILKRINNNEKTSITSIRSIDDCGL